ncbi:MAG: transketolase [Gemmatimonadales bacterium]|nr:MAG: transketolase [Gemmatimonadales bacterium]
MATSPLELPDSDTLRLAIDAVRVLSMDAVQKADSGHPGTPMALAPAGYLLWRHHLRHNPANPDWADRDRFVLSVGHASMLIYSLLHLTGYDLPLEELKNFRQWGSRTAGHPEFHETPGVETTTGPLGQGVGNSVGMALTERWLAHRFNRPGHIVVDHFTWAFCSDGDLMEGISHEAAEIAGHQRLGKLVWIFDDNEITIEGSTDLASSTDQLKRFESYGWHVQRVEDGNDLEALDRAIRAAREETGRPSLIALRTIIAWGSPGKAGTADAHGAPLGEEEIRLTKENLGYPSQEPFWVADEARGEWEKALPRGAALQAGWEERMEAYRAAHPQDAAELERFLSGELPDGWESAIQESIQGFRAAGKAQATRGSSGKVIQPLAEQIPNLLGGSADLAPSNKTEIDAADSFLPGTLGGRNLHFGVREHAMGSILNGMALHGGVRVYGGTFLIFSDYMRPAIRLAALMGLPVTYVFTHDSIGLGEDGPTHQPVEQLLALRSIPGLMDLRPADALETAQAWQMALERTDGPAFLSLTRQNVPPLDRSRTADPAGLRRGGYIFREASGGAPDLILLASGSELHLALEAADALEAEGTKVRVVSLPSWHLFQEQDRDYRDQILPPSVTARVSVEAGTTLGWDRWVGLQGQAVGLDHFGASAPAPVLFREFGVTTEAVLARSREVLEGETPA